MITIATIEEKYERFLRGIKVGVSYDPKFYQNLMECMLDLLYFKDHEVKKPKNVEDILHTILDIYTHTEVSIDTFNDLLDTLIAYEDQHFISWFYIKYHEYFRVGVIKEIQFYNPDYTQEEYYDDDSQKAMANRIYYFKKWLGYQFKCLIKYYNRNPRYSAYDSRHPSNRYSDHNNVRTPVLPPKPKADDIPPIDHTAPTITRRNNPSYLGNMTKTIYDDDVEIVEKCSTKTHKNVFMEQPDIDRPAKIISKPAIVKIQKPTTQLDFVQQPMLNKSIDTSFMRVEERVSDLIYINTYETMDEILKVVKTCSDETQKYFNLLTDDFNTYYRVTRDMICNICHIQDNITYTRFLTELKLNNIIINHGIYYSLNIKDSPYTSDTSRYIEKFSRQWMFKIIYDFMLLCENRKFSHEQIVAYCNLAKNDKKYMKCLDNVIAFLIVKCDMIKTEPHKRGIYYNSPSILANKIVK